MVPSICRASKKPVGILLVKVLRAQNLQKKDLLGKSDPYVKLTMSDDKLPSKKTTVKRGNLNPEWNEDFKFVVTDPETQELEIKVFDWEQAWNSFVLLFFSCAMLPKTADLVLFVYPGWKARQDGHEQDSVERTSPRGN